MQIVVERLTKNITEDHLYEIFGQFGRIRDLDLPMNRQCKYLAAPTPHTARSIRKRKEKTDLVSPSVNTNRGTAYILFAHEPDAEAAIAHMHEAQVDGATINVSIVLARRKMSPPPPLARRGANINPLNPPPGRRGANGGGGPGFGPPGGGGGGKGGGRGPPRHPYGPRSDTWRPRSLSRSPSRSLSPGAPPRRYRGRSPSYSRSLSRSRSPRRDRPGRRVSDARSPSRDSFGGSYRERSLSRPVSPPRGHGRRGYR